MSLRLGRLPVQPLMWSGPTDTGPVAGPSKENTGLIQLTNLSNLAIFVLDSSANSNRKTSSSRPSTHETHSVTSQKQLEHSGITREGHSYPQSLLRPFKIVAGGIQCASRSTITPTKTYSANLYRHSAYSASLLSAF